MASIPQTQRVLSLPAIRQKYDLEHDQSIPAIQHEHEVLVKTEVIGLNPIDWKAPDYGFGIPVLPYIPGRELVGHVAVPASTNKRLKLGDRVALISTDYRDLRKATYQEYAISSHFNLVRLPQSVPSEQGAAIGVAFVTGALALGVCTGLDFSTISHGPDLVNLVRNIDSARLPKDVRAECVDGISLYDRPRRGDWLAIWGGSSTCAIIINQLARLAGLRTIIVLDVRKHANTLATDPAFKADFVVDSHDPERAIEIVRSVTGGSLRFAIDVVGKTTSEFLAQCLQSHDAKANGVADPTPPGTPPSDAADKTSEVRASHLTGLTGLPKHVTGAHHHSVPVKLFHEVPEVGEALVLWLERLLGEGLVVPPRILGVVDGLEGVNDGLDRMRKGEISGGRLVARIR